MEYIRGLTLEQIVFPDNPLPEATAIHYIRQVGEAIFYYQNLLNLISELWLSKARILLPGTTINRLFRVGVRILLEVLDKLLISFLIDDPAKLIDLPETFIKFSQEKVVSK